MSGMDAGGKGNGDGAKGAKKGGGFLDGLRSFGRDFAESFARHMSVGVSSGAGKPNGKPSPVDYSEQMKAERQSAAKQIHRSVTAWNDRGAAAPTVQRKQADEEAAPVEADEAADAQSADGAADKASAPDDKQADAGDRDAAGGEQGEGAEKGGELAAAETKDEGGGAKDADANNGAEAKPEERAEKPSLSVAAKLKGVHRKVFRTANAQGAASGTPAAEKKEAFKPKSAAAGGDTVESYDNSGKPGLKVAGKPGSAVLDAAVYEGPLSQAKNKAGAELVDRAAKTVQEAQKGISALALTDGKVSAADQKTVDGAVDQAAAAVSGVLKTMKIESLARAMVVGDGLPSEAVSFKSQPSENDVEREQFRKELERQLEMQKQALNNLTIDDWAFNINVFKLDQEKFEKMHESARLAVLNRLKEDAQTAVERARTKKAEKEAALKEIQAAIAATKKGEKKTPDIKNAKDLGIGGREGDEKSVRKDLKDSGAIDLLKKEVSEWSTLVKSLDDIVVLHNPDQVAGGGDKGLAPIPPKPSGDDPEAMKKYIAGLKQLLGANRVNGSIGVQWDNKISAVYKSVTSKIDQTAWPLFKLNLNLSVE